MTQYNIGKPASNRADLVGQRFGKLIVISYSGRKRPNNKSIGSWLCKCDCGNETIVNTYNLTMNKSKSCGCLRHQKAHNNKTFEEITGLYWVSMKCHAKSRNIPFNITIQEGWEVFLEQDKKCRFTGINLTHKKYIGKKSNSKRDLYQSGNASLDRIDSSKGYTKDNVQWIYKPINKMKNKLSDKEFLQICRAIVKHTEMENIDASQTMYEGW